MPLSRRHLAAQRARQDRTCPKCQQTFFVGPGGFATHVAFCGKAEGRFWSRVDKNTANGCWHFTGCLDKWGYGDLRYYGKHIQAHRLAWFLLRGDPGKMDVLHKCNNPTCCNPDHLYLGTDKDNSDDRRRAGTITAGERNHHAKITDDDVLEIRRTYKREGRRSNTSELANRYGLRRNTIHAIIGRRTWKHLP
jgi:hypothetical protein